MTMKTIEHIRVIVSPNLSIKIPAGRVKYINVVPIDIMTLAKVSLKPKSLWKLSLREPKILIDPVENETIERRISALNHGILLLGVPSVFVISNGS